MHLVHLLASESIGICVALPRYSVQENPANLALQIVSVLKDATSQKLLHQGKEAEIAWGEIRRVGGMLQQFEVKVLDVLHCLFGCVGSCIVLKNNVRLKNCPSLVLNVLLEACQDFHISIGVYCCIGFQEIDCYWAQAIKEESDASLSCSAAHALPLAEGQNPSHSKLCSPLWSLGQNEGPRFHLQSQVQT